MAKKILNPWLVINSENKPRKCILSLPGRGGHAFDYGLEYAFIARIPSDILYVSLTPDNLEWYPLPNGPEDQVSSIEGQTAAVNCLSAILKQIKTVFHIDQSNIALTGLSAGGVMALQLSAASTFNFAAVVCHAGAILKPSAFPSAHECQNKTPHLLIHSMDDNVFKWDERFVPMKEAMIAKGYHVRTVESMVGGHGVSESSIAYAMNFMRYYLDALGPNRGQPAWMKNTTTTLEVL